MNEVIAVRHRPFGAKSERFRRLLRRYPDLAQGEVRELVSIYGRLTLLEIALISADETASERLDAFVSEHCSGFGCSWRRSLSVLLALLAGFAAVAAAVWLIAS